MTVSALVNTERPIILIYNPDQSRPDEYAEIKFKTQADGVLAVRRPEGPVVDSLSAISGAKDRGHTRAGLTRMDAQIAASRRGRGGEVSGLAPHSMEFGSDEVQLGDPAKRPVAVNGLLVTYPLANANRA